MVQVAQEKTVNEEKTPLVEDDISDLPLKDRWMEFAKLQVPRKDFPLREVVTVLFLIVVVWVFDVFVLSKAYDENYFVVQRTVRKAKRHCRDMVINKKGTLTYEVDTCGKRYTYEVHGNKAVVVDVVKIVGDPRKQ